LVGACTGRIGRLCASKNAINVGRRLVILIDKVRSMTTIEILTTIKEPRAYRCEIVGNPSH